MEAPPAFVALEHIECADVEAEARRIEHDFRQRRHILEAEIEALTRDRMNAVRAVAGERKAVADIAPREMEFQRIGPAWAHDLCRTQMCPEPPRHLRIEVVF